MRGHTRIVIFQGATAVVAVVALILSLTTVNGRIDDIQSSRAKASYDTCRVLHKLIEASASQGPQKVSAKKVQTFLDSVGLGNCVKYTVTLTGQTP